MPSFLELPAEIRNLVYHHTLQLPGPVRPEIHQTEFVVLDMSDGYTFAIYRSEALALINVCHQIEYEAEPIFYFINGFEFLTLEEMFKDMTRIGPNRRFLRHFQLTCPMFRLVTTTQMQQWMMLLDLLKECLSLDHLNLKVGFKVPFWCGSQPCGIFPNLFMDSEEFQMLRQIRGLKQLTLTLDPETDSMRKPDFDPTGIRPNLAGFLLDMIDSQQEVRLISRNAVPFYFRYGPSSEFDLSMSYIPWFL